MRRLAISHMCEIGAGPHAALLPSSHATGATRLPNHAGSATERTPAFHPAARGGQRQAPPGRACAQAPGTHPLTIPRAGADLLDADAPLQRALREPRSQDHQSTGGGPAPLPTSPGPGIDTRPARVPRRAARAAPSCRTCRRSSSGPPSMNANSSGSHHFATRPRRCSTQLLRARARALAQHHAAQRALGPALVGLGDHRRLDHVGVGHHLVLELDRGDPLAAGLDHVLGAVGDLHERRCSSTEAMSPVRSQPASNFSSPESSWK